MLALKASRMTAEARDGTGERVEVVAADMLVLHGVCIDLRVWTFLRTCWSWWTVCVCVCVDVFVWVCASGEAKSVKESVLMGLYRLLPDVW
jgi:hypothetical protein